MKTAMRFHPDQFHIRISPGADRAVIWKSTCFPGKAGRRGDPQATKYKVRSRPHSLPNGPGTLFSRRYWNMPLEYVLRGVTRSAVQSNIAPHFSCPLRTLSLPVSEPSSNGETESRSHRRSQRNSRTEGAPERFTSDEVMQIHSSILADGYYSSHPSGISGA